MVRRMCDNTCEKKFSTCWNHIGSRGTSFAADSRMHDALFIGSAEDEWTVVSLGRVYSRALETNGVVDIPEELHPKALLSEHTWSRACYYGDSFERFACKIVLEYL